LIDVLKANVLNSDHIYEYIHSSNVASIRWAERNGGHRVNESCEKGVISVEDVSEMKDLMNDETYVDFFRELFKENFAD